MTVDNFDKLAVHNIFLRVTDSILTIVVMTATDVSYVFQVLAFCDVDGKKLAKKFYTYEDSEVC